MLKAAKILIIISMICCFWCILPLIFGSKALKALKAGTKPTTGTGVCTILFVNVIAGILMLCAKEEDYANYAANA